jgi:hypothetical protein
MDAALWQPNYNSTSGSFWQSQQKLPANPRPCGGQAIAQAAESTLLSAGLLGAPASMLVITHPNMNRRFHSEAQTKNQAVHSHTAYVSPSQGFIVL